MSVPEPHPQEAIEQTIASFPRDGQGNVLSESYLRWAGLSFNEDEPTSES